MVRDFPSLHNFASACYVNPLSFLWLGSEKTRRIASVELQQGDTLGSFLFSLALRPCLQQARDAIGPGFVCSYLDVDAIIAGPRDLVVNAFATLRQSMSDIGLNILEDKCEAFCRVRDEMWPFHRIPFVTDGISILGSPTDSEQYVTRKSLVTAGKERNFFHKLRLLQKIQSASLLLRYCGVGNVTRLLRTAPSQLIRP